MQRRSVTWTKLNLLVPGLLALLAVAAPGQPVVINEVMSSNGGALRDENGDSPDWVELFNAGGSPVDLSGWALSDSTNNPLKWRFTNATVAPGGFLLVYASGKDRQPLPVGAAHPTNYAGLKLWLRAAAVDPADPVQVRAAGGSSYVRRWNDQSGLGNHAQQATDANQPLLVSSVPELGGGPALRFNGSSSQLLLPGILARNDFTLFVVARSFVGHEVDAQEAVGFGGTSGQRYLFGAQHGGDYQAGVGLSMGTNGATVYEHGSGYMPALAVSAMPLPGFAVSSVRYANRQPSLFVQGNLAATGATSARTNVNAPVEIGAGAYGAFQGDLVEVLLFDRPLTDGERGAIEQYLADKYGVTFPKFYHTNFKIEGSGERIRLTRPGGTVADEWPPIPIPRDVSYGRQGDGGTNFFYFEWPTPGAPNTTPGATELLPKPQFSVMRGFYTNAFQLTMTVSNAGATIRYTLDGSEPTTNSPLYTGPITIGSRAGEPNDLSMIPTAGGWQPPLGEVFKVTVVRSRTFKPGGLTSGTKTHTYLVAPVTNRYSLPILSLATDRRNFFDPNIGIYVVGNAPGGNFWQRGDAWERPVHVEFFEPDGTSPFSQDAGVKIHGNTSRGFPLKALDLIADWADEGPFHYPFFTNRAQTTWRHILLRQSGHDYWYTYFRDALMHDLAEDFGADTMATRPCVLFLDGEYWGIHNLREKQDEDFIAAHGGPGVTATNIDFLEGYAAALAGDTAHYSAMIDFLSTRDIRPASNYAHLQTQMQVDNYVDYKVAEIFTYRWDIGNHRLWRPRTPEGRWRWLQFDNDVGWGGFWAVPPAWEFRMLDYDTEPNGPWTQYQQNPGGNDHNGPVVTFLLRKLLENDTFKRQFINRFADLLNTTYHPTNTVPRINAFAARLAPEMAEHLRRWRQPDSVVAWSNHVQYLRDYATLRPQFCRQHLTNKFGLRGWVTVTLKVSDPAAGAIRVNTIDIVAPTNAPWAGLYFKDNPVTFAARPQPGWRFVNWTGLFGPSATNATNTLLLNGDLALTANFASVPDTNPPVPAPFDLARGPYVFTRWDAREPAGTYPPHMVFLQTPTNAAPDPGLTTEFTNLWTLPYDRTNRCRILGLGQDGFAFLNTSDPQADGGGYLGAAVLGLNTLGRTNLQVTWRGGTVVPNSRDYAVRVQYRLGKTNAFADLLDAQGQPVEYVRHPGAGHAQTLGPVRLPAALHSQPYVQLRWKYHWLGGADGPRAELRVDDITVGEPQPPPTVASVTLGSGGTSLQLRFNATPAFIYSLETSTNLLQWLPAGIVAADAGGAIAFQVPVVADPPACYYRLRWP